MTADWVEMVIECGDIVAEAVRPCERPRPPTEFRRRGKECGLRYALHTGTPIAGEAFLFGQLRAILLATSPPYGARENGPDNQWDSD